MKIKVLKDSGKLLTEISNLTHWEEEYNQQIESTVAEIITHVRKKGDKALVEYATKFDGYTGNDIKSLKISNEQLVNAWELITDEQRSALQLAKSRITDYANRQKLESWQMTEADGSILGQRITALDSVGLYVPGGTAAYPSSVLMNVIPAKVAGVKRTVMVSPAKDGDINPLVLSAAFLCEVDEYYAIGGAQAVAALAYGTETIAAVDKIVGPGNIYVATAKKQVFGKVAIDMIAGPSEVTIIADDSADAEWIVADMFAQAEHDENAQSILITTSEKLAKEVTKMMSVIIEHMPRRDIIEKSITNRGAIVLVSSLERTAEIANLIAPEHLELLVKDCDALLNLIKHAGAIFIGENSCEVLGDYLAGPNHVLPTSGSARFASGLGVYDFQKRSSIIQLTENKAIELAKHAEILADTEGLFAHALSANMRLNSQRAKNKK